MTHELVVLTDNRGAPIGTMPKSEVHSGHTPLHLAFSCYIFDRKGRFLLTRRALSKKVWPGWWTNSVCGHLMPEETAEQAIARRSHFELGIPEILKLQVVLPDYRYTTPPYNGIIENEICPVFVAEVAGDLKPNPDEVEDYKWLGWDETLKRVETEPEIYSWWFKDQLKQLKPNTKFNSFIRALEHQWD